MKSTVLWTLVIINALLLLSFIGRITRENAAIAQNAPAGGGAAGAAGAAGAGAAGASRRPGDYLMIPGEVPGGTQSLVYIVDTTNGWLGAIAYDDTRNAIDVMPRIDLNRAFEAALQRANPNGGANNPGGAPRGAPGRR